MVEKNKMEEEKKGEVEVKSKWDTVLIVSLLP